MQTGDAVNRPNGRDDRAANNFTVIRLQREVGRSNFGAMIVNRQGVGDLAPADDFNRAYGVDAAVAGHDERQSVRLSGPHRFARRKGGSDYAGRAYYSTPTRCWGRSATHRSATRSTPRSASCRAGRTGGCEGRYGFLVSAEAAGRGFAVSQSTLELPTCTSICDNRLESSPGHWHVFEIQPAVQRR